MTHTKEPWKQHEDEPDAVVSVADHHMSLLTVDLNGMAKFYNTHDARRVVACINACAGIPTDTLELVPSFEQAGVKSIREIAQQRDELLAAIKEARECIATDRDSLYETHRNPNTNTVDDAFGLEGLADYDAVLDWIDAVVAKSEAA